LELGQYLKKKKKKKPKMIAISFLLAEGIYTHMYEDNVGA